MRSTSRIGAVARALAALAAVVAPAAAELTPEWSVRLPVGSALTAGLAGLVVDAAGVSYLTGITGSSSNTDIVTAAYGPNGGLLWSHVYNGPENWHDQARWITLGPGVVVYVTGNTPGPGRYANVLLLKYDAVTGALLNTVRYSSGPFTAEHGAAVVTDANGAVYVAGGTVGDGGDVLVLKFDAAGQFLWQKVWDGPAAAPYSQDTVADIALDRDGNPVVLIHGVMNTLHPDYVVVKYAGGDGAVLWEAVWGVRGGDFPTDFELDAAGDFYLTGTGIDFIDRYSTVKLGGTDGRLLWQHYDSIGQRDTAAAVALDNAGGVYITGSSDPDGNLSNFNNNFYTVKRDASGGALLWTHFYGQDCVGCHDAPGDVLVDSAGHVLVVGQTSSPPYSSDMILFVLHAQTGAEVDRGVIFSTVPETVSGGVLRFDAAENLYVGGGYYNANTGAKDIALFKFAALARTPGDLSCDGVVNFDDINPFVLALSDPAGYQAQFPNCNILNGDINGDGFVNFDDINPFVALLAR
ncbi:MAG: hypothetical protein AB1716_05060 [Planctomycetota bacterium]